jgi:hypothetical protein
MKTVAKEGDEHHVSCRDRWLVSLGLIATGLGLLAYDPDDYPTSSCGTGCVRAAQVVFGFVRYSRGKKLRRSKWLRRKDSSEPIRDRTTYSLKGDGNERNDSVAPSLHAVSIFYPPSTAKAMVAPIHPAATPPIMTRTPIYATSASNQCESVSRLSNRFPI